MPEDYGLLPEEAGLLQALLAGEQGLPTMQPVTAVPAEGEQSLPTAQPVQAVPADGIDYVDLSKINLAGLNPLAGVGPAYDPNMVYRFDTGNKIGVPNAQGGFDYQNAAPVVFQPGQQYVMTDGSGKNVIARASTPEEMQKLVDLSSSNKDWKLYQADSSGNITPGAQLFDRSNAGSFGSMILPMAAIAGLGFGLSGLGLGAGTGGAAGAAGTGAAAMPSVGAALADVGAQLAGTSVFGLPAAGAAAAGAGASALAPALGDIIVKGSLGGGLNVGALAPTLASGTLGAALAAAQPGPVNYGDQVYDQPTQDIVVEGAKPIPPVTPVPPLTIDEIMTLPAATTLAPNTSNITEPSTTKPGESNLLNDIMKYYSLGSGVLDALGVGQGGGGTAATTPYTSTLGVLPTFGRGAFTPYQGDYEQYGFGPEFNFFGSQPTTGA